MKHTIDAKNKPLGRIATEISVILQGKKNPKYNPKDEGKDSVVVENIKAVILTGKKTAQKVYYRHAGALGHLKVRKFKDVFAKNPAWVLRRAVIRMLPKNRLRAKRMKRLIIK